MGRFKVGRKLITMQRVNDVASDQQHVPSEYVAFKGLRLPPRELRWGGPLYRDDERYVLTARHNVQTLARVCDLSSDSRVLDIGCGPARLLTGLCAEFGRVKRYVGVDVHAGVIEWARAHLSDEAGAFSFHHLDVHNERYNRGGRALHAREFVPAASASFDLVVLLSVFSHMRLNDIAAYLSEIERVLAPGGYVYLTAFVEYGVPDEIVNPPDYHREWSGPLHCVRLNRHHFEDLLHSCGLAVDTFHHHRSSDGQSIYILTRGDEPQFRARVHS